MRRTITIALALTAGLTSTAHARPLTAHAAKHAIKRDYLYATPDARHVHADQCRRLTTRAIRCRLVDETQPGCFLSQLWDATRDARHVDALTALNMHDRAWGNCPETLTVTPVDGQPTYLPPGS